MKTTGFEKLLGEFSKISSLKFEIWNEQGAVCCSDPENLARTHPFLPQMAVRINGKKGFLYEEHENRMAVFGLPLFDTDTIAAVLLAYCCKSDIDFQGPYPTPGEAEGVLAQIAERIEERWALQNESEEMATELDKSYEALHLYSNVIPQIKTLNLSTQMLIHLMNKLKENLRVEMVFSLMPNRPEFSEIVCQEGLNIKDTAAFSKSLIDRIDPDSTSLKEKYFIVNNSSDILGFSDLHQDPFRFLAVKIQHTNKFYGWLGILSFNMDKIIERSELRLLVSVAEQIGVVISNTDLYRGLETFGIDIVKSLIFTIEAKDSYTRGHSERVHYSSMLMAVEQGISQAEQKILNWSALLHDIGKIGIPEEILTKPGRLTDAEYSIVKEHPSKGVNILKPLKHLVASIPGILHHHEQYDGNGYPAGLRGKEIPLISRIIAVADTFDAITSDRAYRKGLPHEKALKIINEVSGTQLDPEQVQVFNKIYQTAGMIQKGTC